MWFSTSSAITPQANLMGGIQKLLEVFQGAIGGIDGKIVGNIIAIVLEW